jgi:Glycosyltransferase Family 4
MDIVVAAMALNRPGGVESYVLTIAPHLERLGHEVTLYAPDTGPVADLARERGLRVSAGEHQLPAECDAVLSNDAPSAYDMADRYPRAARGLVVHSGDLDVHLPPRHEAVVSFAVALNGVVERRLAACADAPPVTRLRQPIDIAHLYPATPPRERPRHVLLLGNRLEGPARETLADICERGGLTWRQVGLTGVSDLDPFAAILDADIVVGQGRSALDAMACGRATWIYGPAAGDGWVGTTTYDLLEDDGFRGRATSVVVEAESFAEALAEYSPRMGRVNRRLATLNHSPYDHAVAVAGLLMREAARQPPPAPLREMARLVRTQFDAQTRVAAIAGELTQRVADITQHVAELNQHIAHLSERVAELTERVGQLEGERAELIDALDWHRQRWEEIVGTRRWQAARLVAWPLDRARQGRRQR